MSEVRLAVIGVGGMGSYHAGLIQGGKVARCRLTAVCDTDPERLEPFGGDIATFSDHKALLRSGAADAVLIATPHYPHTPIGIAALQRGVHVLVEKPISVHKADCERLIAAHRKRKQVFAAMFNMRTEPVYRRVKDLIERGELGRLTRVIWIVTNWFRTEHYYASGTWRATWRGEGGGVLLNQCPHQLDMLQWLCGMPSRIRGFCGFGKFHRIEVEDDVTAYLEYPNGATGVFVASTGEAPGTNRLEISGESGKIVVDEAGLRFTRNEVSSREFCRTSPEAFAVPPVWDVRIPVTGTATQHAGILENFVNAILDGAPLIAPAREGIRSVEIGNAILFSALTGKPVTLPLDGVAFERRLKRLIRESGAVRKKAVRRGGGDLTQSFQSR